MNSDNNVAGVCIAFKTCNMLPQRNVTFKSPRTVHHVTRYCFLTKQCCVKNQLDHLIVSIVKARKEKPIFIFKSKTTFSKLVVIYQIYKNFFFSDYSIHHTIHCSFSFFVNLQYFWNWQQIEQTERKKFRKYSKVVLI